MNVRSDYHLGMVVPVTSRLALIEDFKSLYKGLVYCSEMMAPCSEGQSRVIKMQHPSQ